MYLYVPRSDEPPGNKLSNAAFTSEGVEDRGPHARWVRELMQEFGVRALPQNFEALGEVLSVPPLFLLDSGHSCGFRWNSGGIYQPKFHSCHEIV